MTRHMYTSTRPVIVWPVCWPLRLGMYVLSPKIAPLVGNTVILWLSAINKPHFEIPHSLPPKRKYSREENPRLFNKWEHELPQNSSIVSLFSIQQLRHSWPLIFLNLGIFLYFCFLQTVILLKLIWCCTISYSLCSSLCSLKVKF